MTKCRIFVFFLELCEREGHEVLDAVHGVDAALSVEQNAQRAVVACFCLDDYLSAGAAGRYWLLCELPSGVAGGNGQHGGSHVGMLGSSREDGASLCAESCGEGGILLITAG